jgi:dTDP-4-amino-4,6-dideoxygalactose transaminase
MTFPKPSQPQAADRQGNSPPVDSGLARLLPAWPPDPPAIRRAVERALQASAWAAYRAPALAQLEQRIGNDLGIAHVHLVCSGTAAVELALRACRLGEGDEVVLAAYDYPGNFRCVAAVGATPVAVDVVADGWTIDPGGVEAAISPRTRAILVSHLYQSMAAMPALRGLADRAEVLLIEDACQAPGAVVGGKPAGSWGDVATLSFGGSKLLTAGTGGAVLCRDPRIQQRLRILQERPSPTFSMSGLQAEVLLPQWQTLTAWNDQRRVAAQRLAHRLRRSDHVTLPREKLTHPDSGDFPALYKFAWLAPSPEARDAQLTRARALGLPCGEGFPQFRLRGRRGRSVGTCDHASRAATCTVVIDHRALAVTDQAAQETVLAALQEIAETRG